MRKEEMDRSRRRRSENRVEKREIHKEGVSVSKSSHYCKSVVKRSHHKDDTEHKRHHRNEKEIPKHVPDRYSRGDRRRNSDGRREWRHRNSPVELVVRGCRNTDSSSSSGESEEEPKQEREREKHYSRRRKRDHEESFEELSRRKRRIESELNALDAEEAAAREEERKQRSNNRHQSAHRRPERSSHHREEKVTKIKQEPLSDDDRRHRGHRSTESRRQQSNSRSRDGNADWGHSDEPQAKPKEKPNFETSGKLAEDTNTFNGVVIKYNEPSEARKPKRKWRLYPFKGDVSLPFIPVHRQSAYLLGRTRNIADIPIDHPSCSKQHAVLQFRLLPYEREDGTKGKSVRPYVIDLESSNGTYVNNKRIEPRRYVELFEKDVLKFGFSTRVYVILHEDSKNERDDEEVS